jgi:hypothetical protein
VLQVQGMRAWLQDERDREGWAGRVAITEAITTKSKTGNNPFLVGLAGLLTVLTAVAVLGGVWGAQTPPPRAARQPH